MKLDYFARIEERDSAWAVRTPHPEQLVGCVLTNFDNFDDTIAFVTAQFKKERIKKEMNND